MPIRAFVVVLPMLIFALAGCGAPPTAEADAARQSMASASSAGADKYAADSLKEAQAAQAALDAELKAQEGKFIKSYDRARELAVAAKAAADKAATDATSARERAEAEEARKAKAAAARREKLAKAVRVGGQIRPPIKMKDVAPVYPAIAQSARVQGDVVIEATIDEEGKVADTRVVKSVPLLDQAALDAVRQWEYSTVPAERRSHSRGHDHHGQVHTALALTRRSRAPRQVAGSASLQIDLETHAEARHRVPEEFVRGWTAVVHSRKIRDVRPTPCRTIPTVAVRSTRQFRSCMARDVERGVACEALAAGTAARLVLDSRLDAPRLERRITQVIGRSGLAVRAPAR